MFSTCSALTCADTGTAHKARTAIIPIFLIAFNILIP